MFLSYLYNRTNSQLAAGPDQISLTYDKSLLPKFSAIKQDRTLHIVILFIAGSLEHMLHGFHILKICRVCH